MKKKMGEQKSKDKGPTTKNENVQKVNRQTDKAASTIADVEIKSREMGHTAEQIEDAPKKKWFQGNRKPGGVK